METPTITLQSIMNFEKGQVVTFNPNNHCFTDPATWDKNKDRIFDVISVNEKGRTVRVFTDKGSILNYHCARLMIKKDRCPASQNIKYYTGKK